MSVPFFARALFAYDAVESSELSVGVGEFLTIEEVNESGWCLARHGDLTGWLPTDYVQKIESELDSNSNSSSAAAGSTVAAEPIQVSKPVNSREIQLAENISPMKPAASTAVAPTATSNSNPSASAGLSEQLSQLIVNSGGVVPSSSSSAPNPNAKICASCHEPIKSAFVMAKEKPFHPNHFQCFTCKQELGGRAYLEKDDKFYCEQDYYAAFNPKCGSCNEVIQGPYISALDQSWHPDHFVCTECRAPFVDAQFRKHDGKPYCEKHFEELFAPKCSVCGLGIIGQVFEALNQKYHLACFTCAADGQPIGEGVSFHVHENKIYCPAHFEDLVLQKCYGCKLAIKGQYLKVLDHHYHPDCWKCSSCGLALKSDNCAVEQGKFYCKPCALKQRASVAPAPSSNGPVFQQIGSNPQAVPNMGAPTGPSVGGDSATEKANIALAAIRARQAADGEAAAATAAAAASQSSSSSSSTAAYADPTSTTYPYSLLKDKNSRPSDVDPTKKEQYLTNEEFGDLFKMSKEDFSKLPEWRRKAIKTPLMLF